jgi:N-acetylmuramoyl-L-alanine amidase
VALGRGSLQAPDSLLACRTHYNRHINGTDQGHTIFETIRKSGAWLFAFATIAATAQTKTVAPPLHPPSVQPLSLSTAPDQGPAFNRLMVVLDPAHGGTDGGSHIGESTVEKNVTLALAFKLRSLLMARGFAVTMTRDADVPSQPDASGSTLTLDDRAGIANHAHAVACLLLHATGSGTGVHLYKSELAALPHLPSVIPWATAQAAWISQSSALETQLANALTRASIPTISSSASVRPEDSLNCPALVVELAPTDSDPDSINNADYQQNVAQAIAGSLVFWRNQVQPPQPFGASQTRGSSTPFAPHKRQP